MATEVETFLESVADRQRRADALVLTDLMAEATGERPALWSGSIVGFGTYHYRYASGREGDTPAVAFAPRKAASTVYLMDGFGPYPDLLARLGPHTTGKSCLYLKRLADVDLEVLREIVGRSYRSTRARNPE